MAAAMSTERPVSEDWALTTREQSCATSIAQGSMVNESAGTPETASTRGVKFIFTRGHISLVGAFKGPNVELLAPS